MKAKVTLNGVRIHKDSTQTSRIVGTLNDGDEIDIEAEYGEWVKMTSGGWIKARYTEPTELGLSAYATKDYVNEMLGVIENGSY